MKMNPFDTIKRCVHFLFQNQVKNLTTLNQDQLDFSFSDGYFLLRDVQVIPQVLEDALEASFPCRVVEVFVEEFRAEMSWAALRFQSEPAQLKIKGVDIILQPKAHSFAQPEQLLESLTSSVIHSLERSVQDVLEAGRAMSKEGKKQPFFSSTDTSVIENIAGILEKIKTMTKVIVENITVRLENEQDDKIIGMDIHIQKLEIFDERYEPDFSDSEDLNDDKHTAPFLDKTVRIQGFRVNLDDDYVKDTVRPQPDSTGTSPDVGVRRMGTAESSLLFQSALSTFTGEERGRASRVDTEEEDGYQPRVEFPAQPERPVPITIAQIAGTTVLKLRIKKEERAPGPMVEMRQSVINGLVALMTPKQLSYAVKILSGFFATKEESSSSGQAAGLNKPIGPEDMSTIDKLLMDNVRTKYRPGNQLYTETLESLPQDCNLLADGEPMFFPMDDPGAGEGADAFEDVMTASTSSISTTVTGTSKATSVFAGSHAVERQQQKRQERTRQKTQAGMAKLAGDTSADRYTFSLKIADIAISVLHEEPHSGSRQQWSAKMQEITSAFFNRLDVTALAGFKCLTGFRDKVSSLLKRDYLGLLCKPLVLSVDKRKVHGGDCVNVSMEGNEAELVECLFDSRKQHMGFSDEEAAGLPQYYEILTSAKFKQSGPYSAAKAPSSAFSLASNVTTKAGKFGYACSETKTNLVLGNLVTEVDITILDRISTLINTVSASRTATPIHSQSLITSQMGFNETMQDGKESSSNLFTATCPSVTVKFRFPIPDLRPMDQHAPREWWGRNLRKEIMVLQVDALTASQSVMSTEAPPSPSSAQSELVFMCNKVEVYLQKDLNEAPIQFGIIQQRFGDKDDFNRPRLVIKRYTKHCTDLEAPVADEDSMSPDSCELEQHLLSTSWGSTPFAQCQEIQHSTQDADVDAQEGFPSTSVNIAPGNKAELNKFVEVSLTKTYLSIELTIPCLLARLHDKDFLELLYNRINNDLLLWEPQSPSPQEVLMSNNHFKVQPLIDMTASMYGGFDFDSDDDSALSSPSHVPSQQQSKLCVSVNVGEGKIFTSGPVLDKEDKPKEGQHCEMLLDMNGALLFVSVNHGGDKELQFICFSASRARLRHAGSVLGDSTTVTMKDLGELTPDNNHGFEHMVARVYRSERSVPIKPLLEVGTNSSCSEDMVTVAVKVQYDSINNNKHFSVAAAVRGGTLRHEKCLEGERWISQIIELLNLKDQPIPGYVMPNVLTDLNLQLIGIAIDYRTDARPKFFHKPLRSLITAERFSLGVNINTATKYTPVKLTLEEAKLYLSDENYMEIFLDRDYVAIATLSLLEMGLRFGQATEGGCHTLLWFSNHMAKFYLCADSAAALFALIDHFLQDRDLKNPDQLRAEQVQKVQEMLNSWVAHEAQFEEVRLENADAVEMAMAEACKDLTPNISPIDLPAQRPLSSGKSRSKAKTERSGGELYVTVTENHYSTAAASKGRREAHSLSAKAKAKPELGGVEVMYESDSNFDDDSYDKILPEELKECREFIEKGPTPRQKLRKDHASHTDGQHIDHHWIEHRFSRNGRNKFSTSPKMDNRLVNRIERNALGSNKSATSASNTAGDEWKIPSKWPTPVFKVFMRRCDFELNLYGGHDFKEKKEKGKSGDTKENVSHTAKGKLEKQKQEPKELEVGGVSRHHDVHVCVRTNKLRVKYEKYRDVEHYSQHLQISARSVEVVDHITETTASHKEPWKMLAWDRSDKIHDKLNMFQVTFMWERLDDRLVREDCSVILTLEPLLFEVNQDTGNFLMQFLTNLSACNNQDTLSEGATAASASSPSTSPSTTAVFGTSQRNTLREAAPIFSTSREDVRQVETPPVCKKEKENLIDFDDSAPIPEGSERVAGEPPKRISVDPDDEPTFIKRFVMTRPCSIRIYYSGTGASSSVDSLSSKATQLVAGAMRINSLTLTLKSLHLCVGYRGLSKAVEAALMEWLNDIKTKQLGSVVSSLSPISFFSGLVWAIINLIRMPIQQYRRDGRFWRGFQKGASGLKDAAFVAVFDLLDFLFGSMLIVSEWLYDMASSGKSIRAYRTNSHTHQPRDIREGLTNAYSILTQEVGGTALDLIQQIKQQHEQKGLPGAVGTSAKGLVPLVIAPVHAVGNAAQTVLLGARNTQLSEKPKPE